MAKTGRKRQRQQRIKEVGRDVEENIVQTNEEGKLQHVASKELFQIDSKGGDDVQLTKKQKIERKDPLHKSKKFDLTKANRYEVDKIKKLQKNLGKQPTVSTKVEEQVTPLWGDDGAVEKTTSDNKYESNPPMPVATKPKAVKSTKHQVQHVEVPNAGQSYNPEYSAHKELLTEAMQQELDRQAAEKAEAEPISKGISQEVMQYLNNDSSDEESESEDEKPEDESAETKEKKEVERMTRSQRHKQARRKVAERKQRAQRRRKDLVKQINTSHYILQDIVKAEKTAAKKQELKKQREEGKLESEPMVRVGGKLQKLDRTTIVGLSDEVEGSLRSAKQISNPLLDRFDSLHKRNMVDVKGDVKPRRMKKKYKIIDVKK